MPEQLAVLASSPLLEALLGPFVLQLENVLRYRASAPSVLLARCAALQERCTLTHKSRVKRLKAKVDLLLT